MTRKFSWLRTTLGAALASGLVFGAWSAPAHAGSLYRWEAADGSVSFTDDAKRVPEKYRSKAQQIDTNSLSGYGRYTPTDAAASADYTKRLNDRLEALRAANQADDATEAARAEREVREAAPSATATTEPRMVYRRRAYVQPDGTIRYRYTTNQVGAANGQTLAPDPNDPNPVVTEEKQVHVPGEPITQTITVTRQGDRILGVTRQRSHYHRLEFGDLSDYGVE